MSEAEPNEAVENFLSAFSPEVQEIMRVLRQMVLELTPGLLEQVDLPARMLAYGFSPTYKGTLCVLMPLKAGVNLGFPRGAEMADPHGLLSGSGKKARHVRIERLVDARQEGVRELLDQALGQVRGG